MIIKALFIVMQFERIGCSTCGRPAPALPLARAGLQSGRNCRRASVTRLGSVRYPLPARRR
jgi:hypothetical protein